MEEKVTKFNPTLTKDLTEARDALKRVLEHEEIKNFPNNPLFRGSFQVVIKDIDKLLVQNEQNSTGTIKSTAPLPPTQEKKSTATTGQPIVKVSSLEERYNNLYSVVPWLKDLEICKFLTFHSVRRFMKDNPKIFLESFYKFDDDREEHKNVINENLLKELEGAANLEGVKDYNLDKFFQSNPLTLIHRYRLTLEDLKNNPDISADLTKLFDYGYHQDYRIDKLYNDIEGKLSKYKYNGAKYIKDYQ